MSGVVRVQLRRTKGWKMPPNTVSVARPGPFGNPFVLGQAKNRHGMQLNRFGCVEAFREMVLSRSEWRDKLRALQGFNLACWCPIISHGDYCPCHADVLISLANDVPLEEVIRENTRRAEGETL